MEEITCFYCPITYQIFNDPITIETGITYERTAIKKWLQIHNICPMTKKIVTIDVDMISTNIIIKKLIKKYLIDNPRKITTDYFELIAPEEYKLDIYL